MKVFKSIFPAAALSLFFLCACSSPSHKNFTEADSGMTLRNNVGDTFTIVLPENPTTGYSWTFSPPLFSPDMLLITEDEFRRPETSGKMVGVPGERVFSFKSIGPGTTGIKLEYRRPWEQNAAAEKSFHLLVIVSGEPEAGENIFKQDEEEAPRINSKGENVPPPKGLLD